MPRSPWRGASSLQLRARRGAFIAAAAGRSRGGFPQVTAAVHAGADLPAAGGDEAGPVTLRSHFGKHSSSSYRLGCTVL